MVLFLMGVLQRCANPYFIVSVRFLTENLVNLQGIWNRKKKTKVNY